MSAVDTSYTPITSAKVIGMASKEVIQVKKPIPPDGGWGWMVVAGFATCNLICTPMMQCFGLLYRSLLMDLGINSTDMSIIVNLNSAFGFLLGVMNGPMLRTFGYRKVAIFGSMVLSSGYLCTSFSMSLLEFMVYYGLITSLGYSLVTNAFSLAINTYFVENRSTATGIAMTVTGLGPIFFPLLISLLKPVYNVRGTAMILVGVSLHNIVAAMLLQPVKWHYKRNIDVGESKTGIGTETGTATAPVDVRKVSEGEIYFVPRTMSTSSDGMATERVQGEARRNINSTISGSNISLSIRSDIIKQDSKWWRRSKTSLNSVEVPFDVADKREDIKTVNGVLKLSVVADELNTLLKGELKQEGDVRTSSVKKQKTVDKESWWDKVVRFFDLDLFKDPSYLSISIGLSIALTGEYNFSLMLPFILGDRDFSIKQTAVIMSVIATADIISRFITPFIGNRTGWTEKNLYLLSLVFLVVTRFMLLFVSAFEPTVIVAVFVGIAKGVRTVYMVLVLPSYVPIDKLGSGAGLQAAINGLGLITFGPLIGYVRDKTGSYNYCILIMNMLTTTTILLWTCELVYKKLSNRQTQRTASQVVNQ